MSSARCVHFVSVYSSPDTLQKAPYLTKIVTTWLTLDLFHTGSIPSSQLSWTFEHLCHFCYAYGTAVNTLRGTKMYRQQSLPDGSPPQHFVWVFPAPCHLCCLHLQPNIKANGLLINVFWWLQLLPKIKCHTFVYNSIEELFMIRELNTDKNNTNIANVSIWAGRWGQGKRDERRGNDTNNLSLQSGESKDTAHD